jgi:Ferritin-like domain
MDHALVQEAGDAAITAFLESVELAIVAAYEQIAAGDVTPELASTLARFADHHREHATALADAAGDEATGAANPELQDDLDDQLGRVGDEAAVLDFASSLESSAAATYLFALGALEARGALELAAAILPVESEHAIVFGRALELPATELVPSFQNQDAAFKPESFPID